MNQQEVKERYERTKPTAPFHVGQSLKVVLVGRNTITVSFFDGRSLTVTKRLEVTCDDQPEVVEDYHPAERHHAFCAEQEADWSVCNLIDALDILTEGEGESE
jgi:hypothetical protein